jgi:hypothetical protein
LLGSEKPKGKPRVSVGPDPGYIKRVMDAALANDRAMREAWANYHEKRKGEE